MSDLWIEALRAECALTSQAKAARRIGYSPAVVNQVLKGTYGADTAGIQTAVEGALMQSKVDCPALGMSIRTDQCMEFQRRRLEDATAPHHARLYRTCPTCPNKRQFKTEAEESDDVV